MTGSDQRSLPTPLPKRASLVAQVRDVLRDSIRQGTWSNHLPGELGLARRLQVSRMTLRGALAMLAREGWVTSSQGRRRRILKRAGSRIATIKRIVLLTGVPLERMQSLHLLHVDGLRETLAVAGFELEVHDNISCFSARPEAALEKLAREKAAACWVLMNSTAPLQRWFTEQKRPCVIVGARHPDILLPSIGTDYIGLGRHAAGQFLRRGHRDLAVLLPDEEKAGHTNTVMGFRDACSEVAGTGVRVVRHDGTPAGLQRTLAKLLPAGPLTGILVALPQFTVGTVSGLIRSGVRVGEDLSVISRDSDLFMKFVVPTIARYAIDVPSFVQKLSRLVLTTAQGDAASIRDTLLVPEFVAGETLGACPTNVLAGRE